MCSSRPRFVGLGNHRWDGLHPACDVTFQAEEQSYRAFAFANSWRERWKRQISLLFPGSWSILARDLARRWLQDQI